MVTMLTKFPPPAKPAVKLRVPQIRVLQVLVGMVGGLTRAKLSEVIGNRTGVVVGRSVGYSDPVKRAAFEQTKDGGGAPGKPCPSLLTLGYVSERTLDIDGVSETYVSATDAGAEALAALGDIKLAPMGQRDSYATADD